MENITNQVLKLSNGLSYFVLRQATYRGVTYFLGAQVSEDGEDFTNEFVFLENVGEDGKIAVKKVTDSKILDVLAKNIKLE